MNPFSDALLKSGAILGLDQDHLAIGWGDLSAHGEEPTLAGPAFYVPDFFLKDQKPWKTFESVVVLSRRDFLSELQKGASFEEGGVFSVSWELPSEMRFFDSFSRLQEKIAKGLLHKGVPVVFETGQFDLGPAHLRGLLSELLKLDRGRIYGFWSEGQGVLGLTPEDLFVRTSQGPLRTMALAGTFSRERPSEELLADPKERKEHQWVIDGISQSLARWGDVSVGQTSVVELPTLMHLRTPIEIQPCETVTFMDCVRALHPTAALGAAPREAGWEWLLAEDFGVSRGRFGAPFGFRGDSQSEGNWVCGVAIRNIQWEAGKIRLGAGCGVVQQSVFEKEWRELALKRQAVKRNFGW